MSKTNHEKFTNILEVEGINAQGFGTIAKMVMLDQRLTIEAKAIYSYFCSYAGGGSTAFPSVSKIVYDLKISKDRYYKHFKLLVECGYITIRQTKDKGKFANNIYRIMSNPVSCPQNEEMDSPCPENSDKENSDTGNQETNINNININNFNNILDDVDDKRAREVEEVANEYKNYSSKKITPVNLKSLNKLLDVVDKELLLYAIQKLEDVEKPMTYLKAIIKDYVENNISTVKQAIEYDKVFKEKKNKNNKKNKSERKQKLEDLYNSATGPILEGYYDWMNE
jgi:DNA replication protein DnaD